MSSQCHKRHHLAALEQVVEVFGEKPDVLPVPKRSPSKMVNK